MTVVTVLVAASIAMSTLAGAATAADDAGRQREWRASVGVGSEYDSNVTVDEVDLSSGAGDRAWVAELDLSLKQPLGERNTLALSYDVSQSNYAQFSRVDRRTQIIGADLSRDLGGSNAGLSSFYIDSRLDGSPFLEFVRISPYWSGFLARKWFARGAYVYSERRIDQRQQRDADSHSIEGDLYFFHRGLRSYLNAGYRYRDEDAIAEELDFQSHLIKLRYIRRLDVGNRKLKGELAFRYEWRDYRSAEPTIGEIRDDNRLRIKADLEIPAGNRLKWLVYASYGDYRSNLPRADFRQTIVGVRLQFQLW